MFNGLYMAQYSAKYGVIQVYNGIRLKVESRIEQSFIYELPL